MEIKEKLFVLSGWYRLQWNDPRLKFNAFETHGSSIDCFDFIDQLWNPDTYLANGRHLKYSSRFCKLSPSGDILYSRKAEIKSICSANLTNFPFDTTKCDVKVETTSTTTADVVLQTQASMINGVEMDSSIEWDVNEANDPYNISLTSAYWVQADAKVVNSSYSHGETYPRVYFSFYMYRKPAYYLLQLIYPGYLLVIISWFAMWTHVPPARTAISMMTLLTNFALRSAASSLQPPSTSVSWLEKQMWFNVLFLFAGTVETALVLGNLKIFRIDKDLRSKWKTHIRERREMNGEPPVNEHVSGIGAADERTAQDVELLSKASTAEAGEEKGHLSSSRPKSSRKALGLCCCCKWWVVYGSQANNWLDVIGQILIPVVYTVCAFAYLYQGVTTGEIWACELARLCPDRGVESCISPWCVMGLDHA